MSLCRRHERFACIYFPYLDAPRLIQVETEITLISRCQDWCLSGTELDVPHLIEYTLSRLKSCEAIHNER